ncbi:hypothetical protein CDD83_8273 [Cordyceps sp. RAO-2017]|nr:hypothetical protein CDD83_8273 [Cordyceps sp. RAO-2017]
MHILKEALSIVAFSALVAEVIGVSLVTGDQIAGHEDGRTPAPSFPHAAQIVRKLQYIIDLFAEDTGGLKEPLHRMSIPVNAIDDIDNDIENEIDDGDTPPTEADFRTYLNGLVQSKTQYYNFPQKLVFWSGVNEKQALKFATANKRFTLGMLIEGKKEWEVFKKPKSEGGYWPNWEECLDKFWSPISKAIAQIAIGDVYVYFSVEGHEEQKQPDRCKTIWCTVEKRLLITSLDSKTTPKVENIKAYVLERSGESKQVGLIKRMTD